MKGNYANNIVFAIFLLLIVLHEADWTVTLPAGQIFITQHLYPRSIPSIKRAPVPDQVRIGEMSTAMALLLFV